ncbi:hypothetical protein ASG82_01810, partial [Mycobacterium sp. Soil538]
MLPALRFRPRRRALRRRLRAFPAYRSSVMPAPPRRVAPPVRVLRLLLQRVLQDRLPVPVPRLRPPPAPQDPRVSRRAFPAPPCSA